MLRGNGEPGPGSACIIDYNIMQTTVEDDSQPWMQRPPIVGLYHELIHALNAVTGTTQPGQTDGVAQPRAAGHRFAFRRHPLARQLGSRQPGRCRQPDDVHRERPPRPPRSAQAAELLASSQPPNQTDGRTPVVKPAALRPALAPPATVRPQQGEHRRQSTASPRFAVTDVTVHLSKPLRPLCRLPPARRGRPVCNEGKEADLCHPAAG